MEKEKKSEYYDSLRKGEWENTADYGPSIRSRYRVVLSLLKKCTEEEDILILDSGCGSGNFIELLRKEGFLNVEGSDFSIEAVKMSRMKNPDIKVFQQDLTKTKSEIEGKYDVIICSEVLEHIEDDKRALANLISYLKEGGILIVSVPAFMKFWSQHDNFSGHVRRYEREEMVGKFETVGFKILKDFYWGTLFYEIYYRVLARTKPKQIMTSPQRRFSLKIIISKVLYLMFLIEDLLINKHTGRRLFVVGRRGS